MIELLSLAASALLVDTVLKAKAREKKKQMFSREFPVGCPIRIFEPDDIHPRFGTEVYSQEGLSSALANIKCCTVHTDTSRYRHGQYQHPMDEYATQFDFHQGAFFPDDSASISGLY